MSLLKRVLVGTAIAGGAAIVGWAAIVRRTGDPKMEWAGDRLDDVSRHDSTISGTLGIVNRGSAIGVVRRVDGRIVQGGTGRVLVTLRGSRPPERGWWVSNFLDPGESCVAEVDIVLDRPTNGDVEVELVLQELGRRPLQHRAVRVKV